MGLCAAAIAAGVGGAAPADEKADVDRELQESRERLNAARGRERVLTDELGSLSSRIRVLEQKLEPLRAEAERLEGELAELRERLAALTGRLQQEQRRLAAAEAELKRRQDQLGQRLRQLYVRGTPNQLALLLESGSLSQAVETQQTLEVIADRDRELADTVKAYADDVRATRNRIADVRADVATAEERAEVATRKANEAKAGLERQQAQVKSVADERATLLSRVRGDRQAIEVETQGLEARSAALGEEIRKAQAAAAEAQAAQSQSSSGGSAPAPQGTVSREASSQGFIWPASGVLTSNFGWRWGRMHQGIDIGAGTGTPISAAAPGTVIIAGWNGGYGQMVVVDHGNGISTAYAHMSSMSVGVGAAVGQGTIVGAVGNTGNSTGPHLHFEVRINGGAVDPLPYL
ncbi:MAG: peptidoglycan DD-metalloendopeptidase family protein [Miltoncostaeaceae bacterium]